MMNRFATQTDDQLAQLYAEGCNEAFDALLMRYDAIIHTHIRYSVNDEDLVEDLFQETFIKVMHTLRRGRYQADGHFKAWIMRIAQNLVVDYFRRLKSESRYEFLDDDLLAESPLQQIPCGDRNAEEQIVHRDALGELYQGINHLSPEQREVVRMRYWEDMSFREIAEATGVSINTALGRMRYALMNLRRQLAC